jgi:hypothetical protein
MDEAGKSGQPEIVSSFWFQVSKKNAISQRR